MELEIEKVMLYLQKAGLTQEQAGRLIDLRYLERPASVRHHLACPGGLAMHCLNVTDCLLRLSPVVGVEWALERSPYVIGMLHDMVKCHCYALIDGKWQYCDHKYGNREHGQASLEYVSEDLGIALNAQETNAILYHMGAYGLDRTQLRYYGDAKKAMPREILASHWADDMAASIVEAGM